MKRFVVALALAWLGIGIPPATCQDVYGTIHGVLIDAVGTPVRLARVTAISEEKQTQFTSISNGDGHYVIAHLLPDTYDVRIESRGFNTVLIPSVSLSANDEQQVNASMPRGQASKISRAAAGGSSIKTRSDVSTLVDGNFLQMLPNFDRNITRYELLVPGAQLKIPQSPYSANPTGGFEINVNGQQFGATAIELDGTDNRDPIRNSVIINPPIEAVAEMNVTTQSLDAESGQALSGIVSFRTQSGTNALHGRAFEVRSTDWGQAKFPALQNPSLQNQPSLKFNLFGGALGGPIAKSKAFFFVDYQGTRRAIGATQVLNVPTDLVRNTCLDPNSRVCDLSQYPGPIYDPNTNKKLNHAIGSCPQANVSTNCIPMNLVSPQAIALLKMLPAPNVPSPTVVARNFQTFGTVAFNVDQFDLRVDGQLSSRVKAFGRYSLADIRINAPAAYGNPVGGPGLLPDPAAFAGENDTRNQSVSGGVDFALNSSLLTDLRFGFYRRHLNIEPFGVGTTPAADAGIKGLNLGDPLTSGMPQIRILQPQTQATGSNIKFGYGNAPNLCLCPTLDTEQQFQGVNNWVKNRGNHLIKWGVDFRYGEDLRLDSSAHRSGQLTFTSQGTQVPGKKGQPPTGGLGLATFLLGEVSSFGRDVSHVTNAGDHEKRSFFYGQDTWRPTSKLTLTYGLRWEIYFPQTVTGKGAGGFLDLASGMINVAGYPGTSLSGNVGNSFKNLAPRIGIAYQLLPNTVLRAGYGRSFDVAALFDDSITLNPPVLLDQESSASPDKFVFLLSQPAPTPPAILAPDIPAGQFKLPAGIAARAIPNKIRVATLDSWNAAVQHQLNPDMSLEVAYVGNKATHIYPGSGASPSYNLNQRTIANFVNFSCFESPQPAACNSRFPFFNRFGWKQAINFLGNNASANFNSLQTKFIRRFRNGYEVLANYTWSKGLGFDNDYFAIDPRLNYGPNDFDQRHSFVLATLVPLPFGRGKALFGSAGPVANRFLGGWQLSTITNWASGTPFSPTYSSSGCSQDRDTGPCRPNLVGKVETTGDRNGYFTTTGGILLTSNGETIGPWQRPAVGTFGSAGRNSLRGPAFFNTDLAVNKELVVRESFAANFRVDIANVFNRVNLGLPNSCVDCAPFFGLPQAGVITTLAPNASQRQLEFALRLQF